MNKKRTSIKKQIHLAVSKTILFSLLVTILVVLISWAIVMNIDDRYYANYYESEVPRITDHVEILNSELVERPEWGQAQLKEIVPSSGMEYQVLDEDGTFLYGTFTKSVNNEGDHLLNKVNKSFLEDKTATTFIPIIEPEGTLLGSVVLQYKLESDVETLFIIFIVFLLLTPFIFIMIFTYYYGSKIGKSYNARIQKLIVATKRVKMQDLDFEIEDYENDEISNLSTSFNIMKGALQDSLYQQWNLEKKRSDFIASVSHDIKTPLTIMKANAQMLQKKTREEANKKYIKNIIGEMERTENLVKEFDTRINDENSFFAIVSETIEPKHFFEMVFAKYNDFVRNDGLTFNTFVVDFREEINDIQIDPQKITQVIDNLISNSMRFVPIAYGQIDCYAEYHDYFIKVRVCDNGKGFNDSDLQYVFNKYYQNNNNADPHQGLGLYIVKQIIESHGGNVQAWNDHGARVSFKLPTVPRSSQK
ncbi:HAMP domain-containing sensor histidine kinase [Alkalicoccobacillus porphyridii]|uniref:histidine kinase n=1 Tax=Alkalicoccobacillus porphyridii TaxID=2597270 RepID=A0A553ZXP0_9BACI|nr:HAMP domain-containing sensor histidine kinase [Alkalicoccobacillus porphyridii]TSB46219.1 HAMP domain-containing histidine kinase [Alkalicoccobacillus porphyridii]